MKLLVQKYDLIKFKYDCEALDPFILQSISMQIKKRS